MTNQKLHVKDSMHATCSIVSIPLSMSYTCLICCQGGYLQIDTGETFCGDAAASFLLWAGTRYCTVFMTDMEEAYRHWDKMLNAGAQRIYPAHGRPFPADKLRENRGRILNKSLATFFLRSQHHATQELAFASLSRLSRMFRCLGYG